MSVDLALRGVVVRRGKRLVLDVPALEVPSGQVLAVLGPNGAGKSTLLQVLAMLDRPASGEVLFGGVPARGREHSLRRRMAVVFQESLLLSGSVHDNVALGLRLRGVGRSERARRASVWLDRLGISALARRPAHALSGGEAQRVSLARALALEPDVLLLDEPFSGLDAPTRLSLLSDLARLVRGARLTTVFVTHDRDEALHLADRVAVLIGGRLRQEGTVEEVFVRPADPEVAAFVGVENVLQGRVVRQEEGLAVIRCGGAEVAAASDVSVGASVFVCVRPEEIVLAPPAAVEGPSSARNRLVGRVTALLPAGSQRRVELDCGLPLVALVTRRSAEELSIAEGGRLAASFKATAVHVIDLQT
jgi:molybdopterin-binding protein